MNIFKTVGTALKEASAKEKKEKLLEESNKQIDALRELIKNKQARHDEEMKSLNEKLQTMIVAKAEIEK